MISAPPPAGIFPLHARPQLNTAWAGAPAPLPAAFKAPLRQAVDPAQLVRGVTGAVVAVSAAMRALNTALEQSLQDPEAINRAMAALNAAVADQALTAKRVLRRFGDED